MKLTIIPQDKKVKVNGVLKIIDTGLDKNIHAIQWDGKKGRIELKKGGSLPLANIGEYSEIISLHKEAVAADRKAEKERLEEEKREEQRKKDATPEFVRELRKTESVGRASRILEEVLDNILNGEEVSEEAKSWLSERKNIRDL